MSRIAEEEISPKAKTRNGKRLPNSGARSRPKSAIASVKLSKTALNTRQSLTKKQDETDDIFGDDIGEKYATMDKNEDKSRAKYRNHSSAIKTKDRYVKSKANGNGVGERAESL